MNILLIIIFLIVVLLFGLSSISQSYASAKQAQATIEASRAAQIASAGNLIIIALVIVAVVVVAVLLTWVYLRTTVRPKRRWAASTNSDWDTLPQQTNAMLPTLVSMLVYQLMQSQQEQQRHEVEQFWMMHEPDNDIPTFTDKTWDL